MNKSRSIKQIHPSDALPNFRNLGVTLRMLLLGNGLALLAALLQANDGMDVLPRMMQIATLLTPVLLGSLVLLWLARPVLNKLAYWPGVLAVNALVALFTLLTCFFAGEYFRPDSSGYFDTVRCVLLSVAMCSLLLMYFRLRARVLSRSLEDARLQVLRARIRPHFLYNTINTVLGIVRAQPKLAETALEDMADLFRMAMADPHEQVALQREISICKQYIALEKMRMGDRLHVDWQIHEMPEDAQIPVLLLQPLLENAVYHGIEALTEGGTILVSLRRHGEALQLVVENPVPVAGASPAGNQIALQNIRERLALLFDIEASYRVTHGANFYRVEIILPYVKEQMR